MQNHSEQIIEKIRIVENYNKKVLPIQRIGVCKLADFDYLLSEFAPTQYGDWETLKNKKLPHVSAYQSLFFNTGLNYFENREKFIEQLKLCEEIAKLNSCPYLVLGSPKNRKAPLDLVAKKYTKMNVAELTLAGELGSLKNEIIIGLEANPEFYDTNVACTAEATIKMVRIANDLGNKNIKFHLDSGCLGINNEDSLLILKQNLDIISRIHISEKSLVPYEGGASALIKAAVENGVGISLEQAAPYNQKSIYLFLDQVVEAINV